MAYSTINDPSAQFQTVLYTGNGGTQSITNDGNSNLQPDWIWTKERSNTSTNQNHTITDSSRGNTKQLFINSTSADATSSAFVTSFDSDGFSLGDNANINYNSATYVGWQWKANGGTTSSNSDGSITSYTQANNTAGFSIVYYSGNGSNNATVGHGLSAAPQLIITKNRSATYNWVTWSEELSSTKIMVVDMDLAEFTPSGGYYSNVGSSTYQLVQGSSNLTNVNANGNDYIAYCFRSIKGYSKFGKYTGNGSSDGTFVYTGFKPAWIMTKRIDAAGAWNIQDLKRSPFNVQDNFLQANDADPEAAAGGTGIWDALSNGFKLRQNLSSTNASGGTFLYLAFADQSLVGTNNVIALAR